MTACVQQETLCRAWVCMCVIFQVFSVAGDYVSSIGKGFGCEPGYLNRPAGIKIDRKNRLFVVDSLNHRVQVRGCRKGCSVLENTISQTYFRSAIVRREELMVLGDGYGYGDGGGDVCCGDSHLV